MKSKVIWVISILLTALLSLKVYNYYSINKSISNFYNKETTLEELNDFLVDIDFEYLIVKGDTLLSNINEFENKNEIIDLFKKLKLLMIEKSDDEIFYVIDSFPPDSKSGYFSNNNDEVKFNFSDSDEFYIIEGKWYYFLDV